MAERPSPTDHLKRVLAEHQALTSSCSASFFVPGVAGQDLRRALAKCRGALIPAPVRTASVRVLRSFRSTFYSGVQHTITPSQQHGGRRERTWR